MVQRQQQHVLARRPAAAGARGAAGRAPGRRAARSASTSAPTWRSSRSGCGQGASGPSTASAAGRRRRMTCDRLVLRCANVVRSDLVAAHQLRPAPRAARPRRSVAVEPQRERACCTSALPGSSWSRNHSRCCANDSGGGGSARAATSATAPAAGSAAASASALRQRRHRGRLEERAQRQLDAEPRRAAGHHLGGQQRVAAQLEEVVVDADLRRNRSTSAQMPRASPPTGVRGGYVGRCAWSSRLPPAPAAPCGPPCRWASAAARPARTNAEGTMYSGRRCSQERAQRVRRRRVRLGHDVGDEPLVARRCPRAPRPRPRARRGARASAASISPSSMRKPRILTWWSRRPRNSSVAVRAASAPGRRCGTAARRAPRRTGPGRSARRSAPAGRR